MFKTIKDKENFILQCYQKVINIMNQLSSFISMFKQNQV